MNPRALSRAGAFVASVDDTSAQYYNPAAFGFMANRPSEEQLPAVDNNDLGRKRWGIDIHAGVGYRLHEDLGRFLNDLSDIDIDDLSQNGVQSESDLKDLVNLANNLEGVDEPGNAITADAGAAAGVRVRNFAVGVRGMIQASGRVVELDMENLGIASMDLNAEINGITLSNNDGDTLLFTSEQQADLAAAGLDAAAIQKLDSVARQEGVTGPQASQMVDLLADIASQSISGSGGDLEDNTTTVLLSGFGVYEIPLSYGLALNQHLAIGANLKLMTGRVYRTEVVVFDNDADEILSEADSEYQESTTYGIDLGIMARIKNFNFGLVARNINSPTFDGPKLNGRTFDDVTIDPQVAAGVAYIPSPRLKVEVDMDLTSNETALDDYRTQNVSLGVEWDVWRFLALRAGAYRNLEEDDIGLVYTLGLGLNIGAFHLDLAGAFSGERAELDGSEWPEECRLAAQLSWDL